MMEHCARCAPDAFGVLRRNGESLPFFLEWERRAVRPVTMAARLAPYLRYYSTRRPLDDHGAVPVVLVVFDDELAATHFLRLAKQEMERSGADVPLRVSHRAALEQSGPLERVWTTAEGRRGSPSLSDQRLCYPWLQREPVGTAQRSPFERFTT